MNTLHRYGHIKDRPGSYRRMCSLARLEQTFPPTLDLTAQPHARPVYDQLQHGSCVWNALLFCFDYVHHALTGTFADLSRMFGYRQTMVMEDTDPATDGGCMPADAFKFQMETGCCDESMWPYTKDDTGLTLTPPKTCWDDALTNHALQDQSVPADINTLKSLLIQGYPVLIGIQCFPGDNGIESENAKETGIVGYPSKGNQMRSLGGHGVAVVGWDDTKQIPIEKTGWWPWQKQQYFTGAFLIRNSWGPAWGLNGNFYLAYEFVKNPNFCDSFWTFTKVE